MIDTQAIIKLAVSNLLLRSVNKEVSLMALEPIIFQAGSHDFGSSSQVFRTVSHDFVISSTDVRPVVGQDE